MLISLELHNCKKAFDWLDTQCQHVSGYPPFNPKKRSDGCMYTVAGPVCFTTTGAGMTGFISCKFHLCWGFLWEDIFFKGRLVCVPRLVLQQPIWVLNPRSAKFTWSGFSKVRPWQTKHQADSKVKAQPMLLPTFQSQGNRVDFCESQGAPPYLEISALPMILCTFCILLLISRNKIKDIVHDN